MRSPPGQVWANRVLGSTSAGRAIPQNRTPIPTSAWSHFRALTRKEEPLADGEVQRGSRLQPEPPEDAEVPVARAALSRDQLLPEDDVVRRVIVQCRDPNDRPRRGMAIPEDVQAERAEANAAREAERALGRAAEEAGSRTTDPRVHADSSFPLGVQRMLEDEEGFANIATAARGFHNDLEVTVNRDASEFLSVAIGQNSPTCQPPVRRDHQVLHWPRARERRTGIQRRAVPLRMKGDGARMMASPCGALNRFLRADPRPVQRR